MELASVSRFWLQCVKRCQLILACCYMWLRRVLNILRKLICWKQWYHLQTASGGATFLYHGNYPPKWWISLSLKLCTWEYLGGVKACFFSVSNFLLYGQKFDILCICGWGWGYIPLMQASQRGPRCFIIHPQQIWWWICHRKMTRLSLWLLL